MDSEAKIDEKLYSRQIYVFGVDGMKKFGQTSVLISGMGGLGVEIAKNVILAGINNVTVHDTRNCEYSDLASNFYLKEENVGENRAVESQKYLKDLNDYAKITAETGNLTDEFLKKFDFVILTDYHSETEIKRISSFCHKNGIKLILTETCGVFGYLFNDFGDEFIIINEDGEPAERLLIANIENKDHPLVTVNTDRPISLNDTNLVRFEDVGGMTEINGKEFKIKFNNWKSFYIFCDTTNFGSYDHNHCGYGIQIKMPKNMKFLEYTEALHSGKIITEIFDKSFIGRDEQIILAFQAYHRCLDQKPDNKHVNSNDLITAAQAINEEFHIVKSIDESLLKEFARETGWIISPTCATFGGIVGHQILIALSQKGTPFHQFLSMGQIESLSTPTDLPEISVPSGNDRYEPYRAVFGNDHQEKMMSLNYFVIGAGALGCEELKNLALMGIGTETKKGITVTDMDTIERSNLNRQFLFRNSDIGEKKSVIAQREVKNINSSIKIIAKTDQLSPETRRIFNDDFYNKLDGVLNAVDNIKARKFSSKMCILYKKPMIDSGTLGASASIQTVVPDTTEEYAGQEDSRAKDPMCTIRNFPTKLSHCVVWAQNQFKGIFEAQPEILNGILQSGSCQSDFLSTIEKFRKSSNSSWVTAKEGINSFLKDEKCDTFDDCVAWARHLFDHLFNFRIRDLQRQFPKDRSDDSGVSFWSGDLHYPEVAEYDPSNKYHAEFVTAAAALRASIVGLQVEPNAAEKAASVPMREYVPSVAGINDNDDNEETELFESDEQLNQIASLLESNASREFTPVPFDKDNDVHVDLLESMSCIRAANYKLRVEDRSTIMRISGNIVPAVSTATAAICGLVMFEMYKLHCPVKKPCECFREGNLYLATSAVVMSQAAPCDVLTCAANGRTFTVWDKWTIRGFPKLSEVVKEIEDVYKLVPKQIAFMGRQLYDVNNIDNERMSKKVDLILRDEFNFSPVKEKQRMIPIVLTCVDLNGNEVRESEFPEFLLFLKNP